MAVSVGMSCPLLPDYVQKEFIGRANAINELAIGTACIFATSSLL